MGIAYSRDVRTEEDFEVGDMIRVRLDLPGNPNYGWGSVKKGEVGEVTSVTGNDLRVNFPSQSGWMALASEMELEVPRVYDTEFDAIIKVRDAFAAATADPFCPGDLWPAEAQDAMIAQLCGGLLEAIFKPEHLIVEADKLCKVHLERLLETKAPIAEIYRAFSSGTTALVTLFTRAIAAADKSAKWRSTLRRTLTKGSGDMFLLPVTEESAMEPEKLLVTHALTCSQEYLDLLEVDILARIGECRRSGAALEWEDLSRYLPLPGFVPLPCLKDISDRVFADSESFYTAAGTAADRSSLAFFDYVLKVLRWEEETWKSRLPGTELTRLLQHVQDALVSEKVLENGCAELEDLCRKSLVEFSPVEESGEWGRSIELFGVGTPCETMRYKSAEYRPVRKEEGDVLKSNAIDMIGPTSLGNNQPKISKEAFDFEKLQALCPKPNVGNEVSEGTLVVLNPQFSDGASAARATQPLQPGTHYWVVQFTFSLGSDSVMGVCTESQLLSTPHNAWLVGETAEGWGLHHDKGLVHDGKILDSGCKFQAYEEIGLLLDTEAGTLQFIRDDLVFATITDLPHVPLFPVVSTTCHSITVRMKMLYSSTSATGLMTKKIGILKSPFNPLIHAMETALKERIDATCHGLSPEVPAFLSRVIALCEIEARLADLKARSRLADDGDSWKLVSLYHVVSTALAKLVEEADSLGARYLAAGLNFALSRVKDLPSAEAALLTSESLVSLAARTRGKVELMTVAAQSAVLRILRGRSIGIAEEVAVATSLGIACHDSSFSVSVAALAKQLAKAQGRTADFWKSIQRCALSDRIAFDVISQSTLSRTAAAVTGGATIDFLPSEMVDVLRQFETYYERSYKKKRGNDPSRRLMWQLSLGSAVLVLHSGSKSVEIECSPYQMGLLLELEKSEEGVSYAALRKLGVPEDELQSALLSLSAPRHAVVSVVSRHGFEPDHEATIFTDEDRFAINADFANDASVGACVLIRTVKLEKPKSKDQAVTERVEARQSGAVASSIVRALRRSSPMKEHELLLAAQQMCRGSFVVTRAEFEAQLEHLITLQYVSRQGADTIRLGDAAAEAAASSGTGLSRTFSGLSRTFSNDPPSVLLSESGRIVVAPTRTPSNASGPVQSFGGLSRTYSAGYDLPVSEPRGSDRTESVATGFEIRGEESLSVFLSSEVTKVMEMLPELDFCSSAVLLDSMGWDSTKLAVEIEAKGKQHVVEAAGLSVAPSSGAATGSGLGTCSICFDDLDAESTLSLACGHGQHKDCWQAFLSAKLSGSNGRQLLGARCPGDAANPNCGTAIPLRFFRAQLAEAERETYDRRIEQALLASYFASNTAAVSCGCGRSLECRDVSVVVKCECGVKFCVGCKRRGNVLGEAHGPASCSAIAQWNALATEGGIERFRLLRIKPCPGCGSPVNKCGCTGAQTCDGLDVCPNAACDHITCTSCSHEWCWICSQPYRCNGDHSVPRDAKEKFLSTMQRVKECEDKIEGLVKKAASVVNREHAAVWKPQPEDAGAATTTTTKMEIVQLEHRFGKRGVCQVCVGCGLCTGYGSRCSAHKDGRAKGSACGCGKGDVGCKTCHKCRGCAAKSGCLKEKRQVTLKKLQEVKAQVLLTGMKSLQRAQAALKYGHVAMHTVPVESRHRTLLELHMANLTRFVDELAAIIDRDGRDTEASKIMAMSGAVARFSEALSSLRVDEAASNTAVPTGVVLCQQGAACKITGCALWHVGRDDVAPVVEAVEEDIVDLVVEEEVAPAAESETPAAADDGSSAAAVTATPLSKKKPRKGKAKTLLSKLFS